MVLRNEGTECERPLAEPLAAWEAVAATQRPQQPPFLYILQPDHAHVSGALAAGFDRQRFPWLNDELLAAVAVHDDGWELFEGCSPRPLAPPLTGDGHAVPFTVAPAEHFVRAWSASIDRAEQSGPLAALTVSRHFQSLGRFGLSRVERYAGDVAQIQNFLNAESQREQRLAAAHSPLPTAEELSRPLALLQFCDLLSLHLCANAAHPADFSQDFGCGRIRLCRCNGQVTLSPSPFAAPVEVGFDVFQAQPGGAFAHYRRVEMRIS